MALDLAALVATGIVTDENEKLARARHAEAVQRTAQTAVDLEAGSFDYRAYRPLLVEGKTVCVVGVGGIGAEVGRLCAALGMRVVGTRRHLQPDTPLPLGFGELGGAQDLERFLPESDFVVICCQWTPETTRLFDSNRFATVKAGSVLINVARGEIVDEDALADAL